MGSLRAGCTSSCFHRELQDSGDKKKEKRGSVKVREGERSKRKRREGRGGNGETKPSLPSSCPSGRPGVCSSMLSRTTEPGTAALKQVLLIVLPLLPKDGPQLTHTKCAANRKHAENDNARSHNTHGKRGEERGGEREEQKEKKERMREPERLTGEPVFIKVQVQDLSDCQAALSFWFHINAVSFLPRLPSPALPHSSPPFCCSLAFQVLPSRPHTRNSGKKKKKKVRQRSSAFTLSNFFFFCFLSRVSALSRLVKDGVLARLCDTMPLISGESGKTGAVTSE